MDPSLFSLFRTCFPALTLTEEALSRLMPKHTTFLTHEEDHTLVGATAIAGKNILWLAVDPAYRRRGIGSSLLARAEAEIRAAGHSRAVAGNRSSWLFLGAPCTESDADRKTHPFLAKHGYRFGDSFVEMARTLSDFDAASMAIYAAPDDVTFGLAAPEEFDDLRRAVGSVDREWVDYFHPKAANFVARQNGQIIGFAILSFDDTTMLSDGKSRVGNIGCVGVVPEARRGGVGLQMVARAAMLLRERGCDIGYIHYTHLDWWYARLGFRTFLRVIFAHKEL